MRSPAKKPSLTSLVAFVMLASVVYVLSYAPVVRMFGEPRIDELLDIPVRAGTFDLPPGPPQLASPYPFHEPVEWMIDHTPLQEPLLRWAALWGVCDEFEFGRMFREWELETI